jgi:GNAT superfamily N-acetyltransferase
MADGSVRDGAPDDAPALARIQSAAWASAYGDLLPAAVVAMAGSPDAVARWTASIADPPSRRHRVLVAAAGDEVVGFAALGPSEDPDLDPVKNGELMTISVAPAHAGNGHGSRLVNAAADRLRGDGFTRVVTWLLEPDVRMRTFLEAAGWAADDARRGLALEDDEGAGVSQVRLVALLG